MLSKIDDHHRAELSNVEIMVLPGSDEAVQAIKERRRKELRDAHRRQRAMIFGEGAAFLGLILLGAYLTRKYFLREMQLARQQKNFLLSITHELKSPLAAARLNLQTLMLRELDREKTLELAGRAEHDIDRLDRLVQQLLLAARMDDMRSLMHPQPVDLYDLCHSVEQHWQLYPRNDKALKVEAEHVSIDGDPDLLRVALSNLVDNALKYAPTGSAVSIRLTKNGDRAELCVEDRGATIPVEERDRIFDRFYRIGNEETRTSTGTGLGLYIVKKVAELHGGEAMVRAGESGGNVFVVTVPVG